MSRHQQSKAAAKYIDSVLPILQESLKDIQNVAVISTKGGVGKSTIAWHLLPAALSTKWSKKMNKKLESWIAIKQTSSKSKQT